MFNTQVVTSDVKTLRTLLTIDTSAIYRYDAEFTLPIRPRTKAFSVTVYTLSGDVNPLLGIVKYVQALYFDLSSTVESNSRLVKYESGIVNSESDQKGILLFRKI